MKISAHFISLFCLITLPAFAEQSIEVCLIPLREVVIELAKPLVGNLQHMFVRGADGTGLNFEPEKLEGFFGGKARIGKQNYPSATCEPIYTTDNEKEYEMKWQEIVNAYEKIALKFDYRVFDRNCQWATKYALSKLNYKVPKSIKSRLCEQQGGIC